MEINPNTQSIKGDLQSPSHPIKPGDTIAVRVLKRKAPFRYLVGYRGQKFAVNSSVLLNPDDFILIELVSKKPRLQFKFLTHLKKTGDLQKTPFIAQVPGFDKSGLGKWFVNWSIICNIPLNIKEYKNLRKFFNSIGYQDLNVQPLLLAHFWFKLNFEVSTFCDPFFFIRWMFHDKNRNKHREKIKDVLEKNKKILNSHQVKQFTNVIDIFDLDNPDVFLYPQKLYSKLSVFQQILQEETEGKQSKNELISILNHSPELRDTVFQINDLMNFVYHFIKLYKEGYWTCIPLSSSDGEKKSPLFLRKHQNRLPANFEFVFGYNSRYFNEIAVEGTMEDKMLEMNLFNVNKDFKLFVDKYKVELYSQLRRLGIQIIHFKIITDKDVQNRIGKVLIGENRNNIEVFV